MLTSTSFSVYISLHSVLQMKKLMKKMKMNCIEQLQEVIIHKTVVKVNQPCPKVVNNVKNLNGQKKDNMHQSTEWEGWMGKFGYLKKKNKQTIGSKSFKHKPGT